MKIIFEIDSDEGIATVTTESGVVMLTSVSLTINSSVDEVMPSLENGSVEWRRGDKVSYTLSGTRF